MAKYESYVDLRHIAELPMAKRRELSIGRDGKKRMPRKMHLSPEEVKALRTEKESGNAIPNPFNQGWNYFFLEAMKQVGVNAPHKLTTVEVAFKEIASKTETKDESGKTFWQRWSQKENRNDKTGLDWEGRFEQNLTVIQRLGGLYPYGLKLKELGTKVLGTKGVVVELTKHGGEIMVNLNTNSAKPVNELKVRGQKPEATAKPKPKKPTKKPAKPAVKPEKPAEKPAEKPVEQPEIETASV